MRQSKPHIQLTEGRWGFSHAAGWVTFIAVMACADYCRRKNLIEGRL